MTKRRSPFNWSLRSLGNLKDIHPDLRNVCNVALVKCNVMGNDFVVIDGLRTIEEQNDFIKRGVSWTLNSRHLYGYAVDIAALIHGKIRWEGDLYKPIARCFFEASDELDIPIVWGGKWKQRDWGHFELDRRRYPDPKPVELVINARRS